MDAIKSLFDAASAATFQVFYGLVVIIIVAVVWLVISSLVTAIAKSGLIGDGGVVSERNRKNARYWKNQ